MTASAEMEELRTQPRGRGAKAVLFSMLGQIAVVGTNVLTGMITARALAPTGRGEQAAMILWTAILAFATTFGLPVSLSFFLKRHWAERSQLLSSALYIGLPLSVLSGIVIAVIMPRLLAHYSPSVITSARLFLFFLPVMTFSMLARAALEADERFSASTLSKVLTPALTLALLCLFWATRHLSPVTAALSYLASEVPIAVLLLKRLIETYRIIPLNPLPHARRLLSYGFPAYGIDLCGTLAAYIDQAMVVNFLDAKAMGVYVVAISVSRMANFCYASVTMVLFPKAAGSSAGAAIALTGRAARANLLAASAVAVVLLVFSPIATRLLYGTAFAASVGPIRVLSIEAVLGGTIMVLAQAPMALGRPALVTGLQLSGLAVTIPLMFVLVPRFGLIGAATSLLISTCIRFALVLTSFPLLLGHSIPKLWMSRHEWSDLLQTARNLFKITSTI